MRSSALSQAVWNFQAHHFACYPEHDDQWIETACLATPHASLVSAGDTPPCAPRSISLSLTRSLARAPQLHQATIKSDVKMVELLDLGSENDHVYDSLK